MLTAIEIAQLIRKQQRARKMKQSFDTAILGLGIQLKEKQKQVVR
jgi:hypothetical protein